MQNRHSYKQSTGKSASTIIKLLKYYENTGDREINFDCYDQERLSGGDGISEQLILKLAYKPFKEKNLSNLGRLERRPYFHSEEMWNSSQTYKAF